MSVKARMGGVLAIAFATASCASLRIGHDYDREATFAAAATYDWVETPEEELEEVERVNPFIDRRMRRAVDDELESRGFRRVQERRVDLLVSVTVLDVEAAEGRRRGGVSTALLVGLGFGFGYSPGFWGPWGGYAPWWGYSPWDWDGGTYSAWRYRGVRRFGFGVGTTPYFGYPYGYGSYGPYGAWGGYPDRDLRLAPGSFVVDVLDGETGELLWRGWADGALGFAPDEPELPAFISSVINRIMEPFPPERDGT